MILMLLAYPLTHGLNIGTKWGKNARPHKAEREHQQTGENVKGHAMESSRAQAKNLLKSNDNAKDDRTENLQEDGVKEGAKEDNIQSLDEDGVDEGAQKQHI